MACCKRQAVLSASGGRKLDSDKLRAPTITITPTQRDVDQVTRKAQAEQQKQQQRARRQARHINGDNNKSGK